MIETNRIEPVPVSDTDSGKMDELVAECCCRDDLLKEREMYTRSCRVLKVRVLMVDFHRTADLLKSRGLNSPGDSALP